MFYSSTIACIFICLNIINSKEIKIKIDSNDLLKIVSGLINSDNFKKLADQIVQRTAMKYGSYNNPYHPEDNIVDNLDEKPNYDINTKLDEENDKYVEGGEEKAEDQLTEELVINNSIDKKHFSSPTDTELHKLAISNEKLFIEPKMKIKRRHELENSN
ncbi:unnamed protein product [Diatraea saccharalis]|uniref:Uncharacterized protein n=1 Tax=Diatraea saccharalis TaxID=40085 RepID=A0A9N9R061_9NEOP|nr:unnamed protein product [Diatraea saccharalis]